MDVLLNIYLLHNVDLFCFLTFLQYHHGLLYNRLYGTKGDWDYRISDLVKNPHGTDRLFNPCGEFRWSPEGLVSQIHCPHLQAGAPGIFLDHLRSAQMLKREWGAGSNGKLPHLFIPSKTATLVSIFAMQELPMGRTATLVPEFPVRDLPAGRILWQWYGLSNIGT